MPFLLYNRTTFSAQYLLCKRRTCKCTADSALAGVSQVEQLKSDLRRAVASTKRGKRADGEQQRDILRKVEALEALDPTPNPVQSELLSGRWSLLYTGPGRADDTNWEKRTGGVEGPVLAALRPLSANAVASKGITQVIDTEAGRVENIAEFRIANAADGYLNVEGTLEPAQPSSSDGGAEESVRVNVKFTAFSLKIGFLPALKIPLGFANPTGWVDTTFLDDDFRIGRGDKGSVFVTARQSASRGAAVR